MVRGYGISKVSGQERDGQGVEIEGLRWEELEEPGGQGEQEPGDWFWRRSNLKR